MTASTDSVSYWSDKERAERWLRSLQPDDSFSFVPISENDGNAKEWQIVHVVSTSDDHLIMSYPDHAAPQFHRRLFYRDAHTARPDPKGENANSGNVDDDESSQSSGSTTSDPQPVIPWPSPTPPKPLSNVTNGHENVKFDFPLKKARRKRRLKPAAPAFITGDTPVKSSSARCDIDREKTPPQSARTAFNRLHDARAKSTADERVSALYEDTRASKNCRNRRLVRTSTKTPGDQLKDRQSQKFKAKCLRLELQRSEQERKSREQANATPPKEHARQSKRGGGARPRGHGALGGSENALSTTTSCSISECKQARHDDGDGEDDNDQDMRMDDVDDEKESSTNNNNNSNSYSTTTTTNTDMMTRGKKHALRSQELLQQHSATPPPWMTRDARVSRPVGLSNLGNTCFMNSTLQSLIHCTELRRFFLSEHENRWWREQLNTTNPIGYGGKIAMNFASTLYEYCGRSSSSGYSTYYSAVTPSALHRSLSGVLRQFADYRQHDAQEFLTNFLDALHEDLNRVRKKQYLEIPEFDQHQPVEKLREFLHTRWHDIYLKRNNSVCTDLFAGLLRSTVTCPTCAYTAITFDPCMHLLLPLKAPRSMLRALSAFQTHNVRNYSRQPQQPQHRVRRDHAVQKVSHRNRVRGHGKSHGKFEASSADEDADENEDDDSDELQIVLLSKDTKTAPITLTVKVSKEVQRSNDWTTLHARCYDALLQQQQPQHMDASDDAHRVDACRAAMTRSGAFERDSHFLYFGEPHLPSVQKFEALQPRIPKCMAVDKLASFPLFQLSELAQKDKLLQLREISARHQNDQIAHYLMEAGGCRRLVVQQLPSHWTDVQKRDKEESGNIKCYLVFRKPNTSRGMDALKSKIHSLYNGFGNSGDDDDANDMDIDINIGDREESQSQSQSPEQETFAAQLEPFSLPRLVFNKGLTAFLRPPNLQAFLTKTATEIVSSVAGQDVADGKQNEIDIRFTRDAKFDDCLQLDSISDWLRAGRDSGERSENHGDGQAVRSMVIVCSFGIYDRYSKFQRAKEAEKERLAAVLQRKQDHQRKIRKNDNSPNEENNSNSNNKKRSFQAMAGGNSAYESSSNNGHIAADENDGNARKRQKMATTNSTHGHQSQSQAVAVCEREHEHDVRDTSLPAEFQPHETMARSIQQCFGMFLSREQLTGDNKWYCPKCKAHVQGKKKLDLWWLPKHLIIAIKRFDNHGLRKYNDFVSYPVDGLDLTNVVRGQETMDIFYGQHEKKEKTTKTTTNEQFIYDLYAVINHSGSLNFGHYTSTIKFGEQWWSISDSSAYKVDSPTSQQAYILCYKRRST